MKTLHIKSLTLEGVGRFGDVFSATFADHGLTVVHGPNESGKSTILAGIPAVLFGIKKRGGMEHWASDPSQAACRGALHLRVGDAAYTIEREFHTNRVEVTDTAGAVVFAGEANPAGRGTDLRKYQTWLRTCIGMDDADVFRDTAFLHLRGDDTALAYGNTVREMVSGAGAEDFTDVAAHLVEEYEQLTKENPWGSRDKSKNRLIEDAREHVVNQRAVLAEADAAARQTRDAQAGLSAANAELATTRAAAERARDTAKRLREIQRCQGDAAQTKQAVDAALDAQRDAERLDGELADLEERLGVEFGDIAAVTRPQVALLDEAERAQADVDQLQEQAHAYPPPSPVSPNLTQALLACVGGMLLGGVAYLVAWWAGVLVGVGGLGFALYLYGNAMRTYAAESERHAQASAHSQEALADAERAGQVATDALARVPEPLRDLSAATLTPRLHARELLLQTIDLTRQRRAAMPDAEALKDVARNAMLAQLKLDARLEELGAARLAPGDLAVRLQETERTAADAERALAALDRQRQEATRTLGRTEGVSFPPTALLAEEIADLEEHLAALELRRDALHVAVDTLSAAASAFQHDHVGPIAAEATDLFRRFTREGWAVTLSPQDLEPAVSWHGRPWDVARLSAGTLDQLAVALRLAVVQALHGAVRLPLILDDPLAHWDGARRAAFRDLLTHLAGERQIILATPDPTVAGWGQAAIQLSM